MLELAHIVRLYSPEYREQYENFISQRHDKALRDIEYCRTEHLGGQVYACSKCGAIRYSYHSCKNRSCPKCQQESAQQWLEKQREILLPTSYFLVTFTLPEKLKKYALTHQETFYSLFFKTSASALQKLALDPHYLGGKIGMIGVLHTWARDLTYHPHIHYLVPAGGLSEDGTSWIKTRYKKFLVPVKALSRLFRGMLRDALTKAHLSIDEAVWKKEWVVHCKPVGTGERVLRYLAPYIYRCAITNNRLVTLENERVTYTYRHAKTKKLCFVTIHVLKFLQRFLMHVLPKGFMKVRYFGFFSPQYRSILKQIIYLLTRINPTQGRCIQQHQAHKENAKREEPFRCPECGGVLILVETILPRKRAPP